jgi:hypothetical protein
MNSIPKLFHRYRLAVFACVVLAVPVEAAIYKWVDESGQTVYSETPPPKGTAASRLKEPPPPPVDPNTAMGSLRNRAEAFEQRQGKRDEEKSEARQSAEDKKQTQEKCDKVRQNLETLTVHTQVREKTGESEYTVLSEEQRQAKIKKMQDYLQKECSQ